MVPKPIFLETRAVFSTQNAEPEFRAPETLTQIDPAGSHAIEAAGGPVLSAGRRNAGTRRWVALAAAYLVVLQAIFAGLASGANAANFSLDRSLAMTLCAGGDMPASQGEGAAAHELISCCMLGCAFSGTGSPAAPIDFLPVVHRTVDLVAFQRRLDLPSGFVAGRSPANPRAPPASL